MVVSSQRTKHCITVERRSRWADGRAGYALALLKMAARRRRMQQNEEAGRAWSDAAVIEIRCVPHTQFHNLHNSSQYLRGEKEERQERSWSVRSTEESNQRASHESHRATENSTGKTRPTEKKTGASSGGGAERATDRRCQQTLLKNKESNLCEATSFLYGPRNLHDDGLRLSQSPSLPA